MTRAQRIVVVAYCLLIAYCCVWVPRHVISPGLGEVHLGYAWLWSGPTNSVGGPDLTAIGLRLFAATALGTAAFLLARKWRAILLAGVVAGLGCAGILLYGYWTQRATERRTQQIHNCAVAKVATAKCTPSADSRFEVCDPYALSHNPTAQSGTASVDDLVDEVQEGPVSGTASPEDAAIKTAEKECAIEMEPRKQSAHEQIEEYKHQHGIKQ